MDSPADWSYPARLTAIFGLVVVGALLVAASSSTTAFGAYNTEWDGTAELRSIAETTDVDTHLAQNTEAYSKATPESTVALIIAPEEQLQSHETAQLAQFVQQGGTLIVADERVDPTNSLLATLGAEARLDGAPLRDARYHYRSPAAPRIRNLSADPVMANVSALTLNYGTAVNPANATVLATTSEYAYRDTNGNQEPDQSETVTKYPVLTSEDVGQGRVIVLGDASLFINDMLDRPGNRQFVYNVFAGYETLLLDYSHTATVPLLIQGLLVVRQTPLLGFLCGGLGVFTIALLQFRPAIGRARVRRLIGRERPTLASSDDVSVPPSPVEDRDLRAYLRTQYPEWDEETLDRIVAARRHEADEDK